MKKEAMETQDLSLLFNYSIVGFSEVALYRYALLLDLIIGMVDEGTEGF